jgi:hypothetical protein
MEIFSFDVTVSTHNNLKNGIVAMGLPPYDHHRVVVAADTHTEAFEIAFAMPFVRGYYVTGVYDRI